MELLFGYPALVVGLTAGFVTAKRDWPPVSRLLVVGVVAFVALTFYQSTVPDPFPGEGGPITAPLWIGIAIANAGSWIFGVGIGVATAGVVGGRHVPQGD